MHKHNPSSSFFYLQHKQFREYVKELKTLVDLFNCESDLQNKERLEQMIENLQFELARKCFRNFHENDAHDEAEWRKGLE